MNHYQPNHKFLLWQWTSLLVFIGSTMLSVFTQALPSDRHQPITIKSKTLKIDEGKGITIYQGSVQIDQGTLRIRGDKVTIHSVDNKFSRIIAIGEPAYFQQQPSHDKALVMAEGSTIDYSIDREKVQLLDKALLEQGGSIMSGDRIDYNIKDAIVVAAGDPDNSENTIQIFIPPQADREASQPKTSATE